jgi:hypothetical protein
MSSPLVDFWTQPIWRAVGPIFLCLVFTVGCATADAKVAVMRYDDFGPQAAVYEWLGNEWWQWQSEGDPDPNKQYDIRVVIYKNCSLQDVQRKYPVVPAQHKDYRYISYDEAARHLDELIADDALPDLTAQLKVTRNELQRRFE